MDSIIDLIRIQIQRSPTSHGPPFLAPHEVLQLSEIAIAEDIIGCKLPNLLQQLYLQIGNGGFGPGYGLLPLLPSSELKNGRFVVSLYSFFRQAKKWNATVIPFSCWGCGILSCLDLRDNTDPLVYRFEPNMPDELTSNYLNGNTYVGNGLIPEEVPLSEWLGMWLAGHADIMFSKFNTI
ncbi:MAG: SMI1/KNR4 family protein [Zavarzinella sp.]